jgi:hypothetical protein
MQKLRGSEIELSVAVKSDELFDSYVQAQSLLGGDDITTREGISVYMRASRSVLPEISPADDA